MALGALLICFGGPAAAERGEIRLDNWFYYQDNYDGSARWQYRPRIFIPFDFASGWTFTQRIDLPFYYTDTVGADNPDGEWQVGASDFFVEEIVDLPASGNMRLRGSLRLVMPSGGGSPFGADQWQLVPGFGGTWRYPDVWKGVTLSPYARYFYGFDAASGVTTKRSWNLFPTVTFGLGGKWSMVLWPEQGITYNYRSRKWFVPAEAMLTYRADKGLEYSFGGAAPIVNDDKSYRWLLQGRVTFFFK